MSAGLLLFDGVWKKFRRGVRHDSLRDLIPSTAKRFLHRHRRHVLDPEDFWALKDVSFEINPGEALGLIGPNGAGKSTILKLLTKILKPTRGHCQVRGRIGALIEVAAGFHPDLTGRENIYLQGAIMGMKRAEISGKFDEIVDFSGISDFIDTQVKRYSSGMHTRLGFSIAAQLDPEVLVIDEVLAVGDFAFQQRAFERIQEIVRRNTAVIVVSHQLERIASLCNHAILLDRGAIVRSGSPADCIATYMLNEESNSRPAEATPTILLSSLSIAPKETVQSGERIKLTIEGSISETGIRETDVIGVRVRSCHSGEIIFATTNARCRIELPAFGSFGLEIDLQMNVPPGVYLVETLTRDPRPGRDAAQGPRVSIQVRDGPTFYGTVQMNASIRLLTPESATALKGF